MANNSGFIGIDIAGDKRIANAIRNLPAAAQDFVVDELSKYIINVYHQYPPRKRITRKQAYGRTFQTAKQRRYFFWALNNGVIHVPYRRTQTLREGWQQLGKGKDSIIVNEVDWSPYVMGSVNEQSRMHHMIGWDHYDEVLDNREDKTAKVLYGAIKKSTKSVGLESD